MSFQIVKHHSYYTIGYHARCLGAAFSYFDLLVTRYRLNGDNDNARVLLQ